jgi:type IV secretory pathway TraG/TraD family ATPase VirD4
LTDTVFLFLQFWEVTALQREPALRYLLLTASGLIVLAVFYVLDVWLLGTLAAMISGQLLFARAHPLLSLTGRHPSISAPANPAVWYWRHPLRVAIAWATRPAAGLNDPMERTVWIGLNLLLMILVSVLYLNYGMDNRKKDTRDNRDVTYLRFKKVDYEALKLIKTTPPNRVVLGVDDNHRPVTVPVLGGTGAGKTSLVVLPLCIQAVRQGIPLIVIDFKGDKQAIQLLAKETTAAGKRFFLFSLHPQVSSNTYNPLSSGSATSKVERIMTALQLVFEGEAKFYTYCQQAMFLPLIKHFEAQGLRYTLADVSNFLANPDLVENITGEKVDPKQVRGLTAALVTYVDLDRINDHEPDIDLHRIMADADVCYFDLRSAVAPEVVGAIGKMIALDLQTQAAYRIEQDQTVMLVVDEFQNMACQVFRNIVSKVRSANYALVLANQARGDLRAVGEDFLNSIMTNTATKVVFAVGDPDDASYFARRSGQIVIPAFSQNSSRSQAGESTGESVQDYDTNLVHANVLLQLPFGKSVVFRKGQLATLTNHAHLVSLGEKQALERAPYPEPVKIRKQHLQTAAGIMTAAKDQLAGSTDHDQPDRYPSPKINL